MQPRVIVQDVIDHVQFWFDVFPRLYYQPLPWLHYETARRGEGTKARWKAIEASLEGQTIRSAMDIGCNIGYFCFSLAEAGIPTVGIEVDERALRIARYTARKLGQKNVAFENLTVSQQTLAILPQVDAVLLLSVWHHWVHLHGLDVATEMLAGVWGKCQQNFYFETGEGEMPAEFGLPKMEPTPEEWLKQYLTETCVGGRVEVLGKFKAFGVEGDEQKDIAYRTLLVVRRVH